MDEFKVNIPKGMRVKKVTDKEIEFEKIPDAPDKEAVEKIVDRL